MALDYSRDLEKQIPKALELLKCLVEKQIPQALELLNHEKNIQFIHL